MMVEGCIFDEIPEEISVHLVSFSEALDNIQNLINNHMSSSLSHKTEKSNLEVIKHELSLCYTLNALFFSAMVWIQALIRSCRNWTCVCKHTQPAPLE
ncbi:hypothetical protein AHF37_10378 [Paragonimus kellicotti]|nr:hypothetical protein AHF37_10378 [Paragonimus kellicotti]